MLEILNKYSPFCFWFYETYKIGQSRSSRSNSRDGRTSCIFLQNATRWLAISNPILSLENKAEEFYLAILLDEF